MASYYYNFARENLCKKLLVNAFSCGRLKSFPEGRSTNVQIIQNLSKRKASPPRTIVHWKANSKSLSAYNFSMRFLRSQHDANEFFVARCQWIKLQENSFTPPHLKEIKSWKMRGQKMTRRKRKAAGSDLEVNQVLWSLKNTTLENISSKHFY